MSPSNSKRSKFELTITHMLSFLGLVAVISCVAIPMFFSQPRITLDNATLLFAKDLRFAQNEAVLAGQTTSLTLDENHDGYALRYSSGTPVPNPVGGGNLARVYSFDAIFRGVQIEALDEGSRTIKFDRNGFTLNSGAYRLSYEGGTRSVEIDKVSGKISIDGLERDWNDNGL